MPCVNAESIYNNLPNLIAYGKKYKALWDNDEEGLTYYNKAVKNFGKIEAHNFNVLPNLFNKKKVRMEEMFEKEDFSMLRTILEMPDNSSYSNIMTSLISSDESIIKLAQSQLSNNAKKAFEELESIIK